MALAAVLVSFDTNDDAFGEHEVSSTIRATKDAGELAGDEETAIRAEWAAFMFIEDAASQESRNADVRPALNPQELGRSTHAAPNEVYAGPRLGSPQSRLARVQHAANLDLPSADRPWGLLLHKSTADYSKRMDAEAARLLSLKERIVEHFTSEDWQEIGVLTGRSSAINGHPRLLRSLAWGDQDYAACVLEVLVSFHDSDKTIRTGLIDTVQALLDRKYGDGSTYVSARPSKKRITFAPLVFEVQDVSLENDLVALMMPFDASFKPIDQVVRSACTNSGLRCQRADDIWDESMIVQDIFTLILRSSVVIVDFTGKNPNVLYETGIAHTLGKEVIPLSQSKADIPFDLGHHRALLYLANSEGLATMQQQLLARLLTIRRRVDT